MLPLSACDSAILCCARDCQHCHVELSLRPSFLTPASPPCSLTLPVRVPLDEVWVPVY